MSRDYDDEIKKEAIDFLTEHEEEIIDALINNKDFDKNEIDCLDTFDESIDPSFSTEDALVILSESDSEGEDYGERDPEKALVYKATSAYQDDVWTKARDFYNEMKGRMTEIVDDSADNKDPGSLGDIEGMAAQQAYDEFEQRNGPAMYAAVVKDSDDERSQIHDWLTLNGAAGTWGGYPVGGSYIDARCGSGHGMPAVKEFVDFDHQLAQKVPWLNGKRKSDVQARYDELLEMRRKTRSVDRSLVSGKHCNGSEQKGKYLRKSIIEFIMDDERLTLADIRLISKELHQKSGGV